MHASFTKAYHTAAAKKMPSSRADGIGSRLRAGSAQRDQRYFLKSGLRFSLNARTPSFDSSLW